MRAFELVEAGVGEHQRVAVPAHEVVGVELGGLVLAHARSMWVGLDLSPPVAGRTAASGVGWIGAFAVDPPLFGAVWPSPRRTIDAVGPTAAVPRFCSIREGDRWAVDPVQEAVHAPLLTPIRPDGGGAVDPVQDAVQQPPLGAVIVDGSRRLVGELDGWFGAGDGGELAAGGSSARLAMLGLVRHNLVVGWSAAGSTPGCLPAVRSSGRGGRGGRGSASTGRVR